MSDSRWTRVKFLKRGAGAAAVVGGAVAGGRVADAGAAGFDSKGQSQRAVVGRIVSIKSPRRARVDVGSETIDVDLVSSAIITRGVGGSVANLTPFKRGEQVAVRGPRSGTTVIGTHFNLVESEPPQHAVR
jgi:hypothetical protein